MKKKFLISLLLIILIFGMLIVSNALATDSIVGDVLEEMDTAKVGITQESDFTKIVRTVYAMIQITVIGGTLIYFTWHSMQFFSASAEVRTRAKQALPYRVGALLVILGIDGLIAIIANYLVP